MSCSSEFTNKVKTIAANAGANEVSVTHSLPFDDIQVVLEERKEKGYAGDMAFTYKNPYRSTHLEESLPGVKSLVVCLVSYAHLAEDEPLDPYVRVAQYASADSREKMQGLLLKTKNYLEEAGWKSRVFFDDNSLVDRAAAMRAGLGFYGKNSLIINKQWGSTVLIGTVATTAPLAVDADIALKDSISGCGTCSLCLPACPTGAIVEPGVIDATKCISWLLQSPKNISVEHRKAIGNRIYGCDECQDVCPHNKIQKRRATYDNESNSYRDLKALLSSSDKEVMDMAGEWYVYKRDPRYIRRNALIVSGNTLKADSELWNVVVRWASSDDEMLSEYAQWALDQRRTNAMGG